MSQRKRRWIATSVAAVVLLVLLGGAHRLAANHVLYRNGGQKRSLECLSCHVYARGGTLRDRLTRPEYVTPRYITVSADGKTLYVTTRDRDSLMLLDPASRRIVDEIPVGEDPHSVVLSPDGRHAYVSDELTDTISVVDLAKRTVTKTFEADAGPVGLALSPDGRTLFVAHQYNDDIGVLDLTTGEMTRRLAAGSNPYDVALSPDGRVAVVGNRLSFVAMRPDPPESELTIVDVASQRVVLRARLRNAHLVEGVAVTPESDLALAVLVRPKNLVPMTQVARGWVMTNNLAVIDLETGKVVQLPLDDVNRFYADPSDVVVTPDGRRAFVTHAGVDVVTAIDMERLRALLAETPPDELATYADNLGITRRYVLKRIETGANPTGIAVSPDGRYVYVAERLSDSIGIIDTETLERIGAIDLGGSKHLTVRRRGEILFNSAKITFQDQFSCRSCHPDGHTDRLQYDFEPDGLGRNILDNRSLLGLDGTGPFKWNGKNTSLYMQCGIRFARFLTRSAPFSDDELTALVAFIQQQINFPNRHRRPDGTLTPAQERGKALFERAVTKDGEPIPERDRCITCHPPPLFTDRKRADVGTSAETDSVKEFDTPHLTNVYLSAPYLHDGRAATLEEIWTKFNPEDKHGFTSDMSKSDLNDLIEYLKTL